jgi:hypothetical protein
MDYSAAIKAAKDLIMKVPASRLVLIWALVISTVLAWQAANILQGIAELAKVLK